MPSEDIDEADEETNAAPRVPPPAAPLSDTDFPRHLNHMKPEQQATDKKSVSANSTTRVVIVVVESLSN